ncbi:MAG: YitT family protein [Acutalibacteraceae bacterium]
MSFKSKKLDIVFLIIGSIIASIGVSSFTAPNGIASGGFTGIGIILYSLFGIPVGSTVLLLNIPVFIISANKFGMKFMYKSILATIMLTVMIDVSAIIFPVYKGEKILSAIFGGLLLGIGLALIFLRGATTGGVDIIAKLLTLNYPQFSIGKLIMFLDAIVIVSSAIVYQNIENSLFAVIAIFVESRIVDTIIYGGEKGKLTLVKSEHCEEILISTVKNLGKIPSFIDNSGENRNIILCATHRYETARFHKIVKEVDESAFIVTLDAGEIIGEGFKSLEST